MGTTTNHQPYNGDKTIVRVAIGKIKPVSQTLTLGETGAKAAVTLTLGTALTAPIDKDNWLLFVDSNGLEYLAKVTADAAIGVTALTVKALDEAIPDEAVAKFPSELYDRSAINLARTYNNSEVFTLNTGGDRQVVATTATKNATAPGFWYWHNAGYRVCKEAAEAKKPVWLFVEYEPPSPAFSKGIIVSGKAVITSRPTDSAANAFLTGDLNFEFTGPVSESDPVPTA
ncbi:hypothetical protein COO91_02047 [Nostoc flagelliforme CCNUN1]|uniref:Uncharacterized protein n=1 Tax=Nostoc flagelliforme CCNUN1 TaxID=2038116 RepID=A0A2K8SKY8_9NOSO|nr:hypothetical protein [Nostoc flagelliforme]AUB36146.1 hypothetical protein COO91_02047 [Nostoc flagelliforme CCNUN1]